MRSVTGALLLMGSFCLNFCVNADDKPQAAQSAPATPPAAPAATTPPPPKVAETFLEAFTGGKLILNLRPRFEYVDQDGKTSTGQAWTNRALFGWETLPYYGFSVRAEGIAVTRLNDQDYNDTPNFSAQYPTIADPENNDINQLYLDYAGIPDTKLRAGRMSLKLDNTRYVGNVEFRQVMQVFNGAMIENKSIKNVELMYAHFDRVKNVFAIQRQTDIDLLRAAWTWMPGNQLIGFGYFQDQANTGQNTGFADNSNRIIGVRANGAYPISKDWKVPYTAEFAKQDDYAGGDSRIDAHYWRAGVGIQYGPTFIRFDHETLSSNAGQYAFQTPLGTNHLFQGWADQFLVTPAQGILDNYITLGATIKGLVLYSEIHSFRSDVDKIRYGSEIDVGATYPFTKRLTGKFEFAAFHEDDILTPTGARKRDTTKVWVTMIYNW